MSRIVKGIFGGASSSERILQRFQPVGFNAPGGVGSFRNNTYTVTPSAARTTAIGDIRAGFDARASAIRGLRGQVTPGFGRLSQIRQEGLRTRLAGIRDEGRRAVGSVREQLARRRLAGSSFQTAEVSRAESMVRQELDKARAEGNQLDAEAFLQEIALNSELVAQEFDSTIQGAQTVLDQLNLDTATAATMAIGASQLMAANIQAQAEARAAQQAAGEDFLGTVLGMFSGKGFFN